MLGKAYTFLKVWDIPIRIHISCVILVPIFVRIFGFSIDAFLMILGLFTSIALHELGHCWVAMRRGCRIEQILLTPLGGAAQMVSLPRRPVDELLMAVAGPAVSLLLALLFLLVGLSLPATSHTALVPIPVNAFAALGYLNVWLVLFNALPAFPMDGGRVLRALLSMKLGRVRATGIAARIGQFIAILFVVGGIALIAMGEPVMSCLILMVIGYFVFRTAGNEYMIVRIQEGYGAGGMHPPRSGMRRSDTIEGVIVEPSPYASPSRDETHGEP